MNVVNLILTNGEFNTLGDFFRKALGGNSDLIHAGWQCRNLITAVGGRFHYPADSSPSTECRDGCTRDHRALRILYCSLERCCRRIDLRKRWEERDNHHQ